MLKKTPTFLTTFFILTLLFVCSSKILQLTQKNLPNVLKTQSKITSLYHHPDCSFSTQYKTLYFNYHTHLNSQIVGIIDCSLEHDLCVNHSIKSYPHIRNIYQNMNSVQLNTDFYLGQLEKSYKNKDQYRSAQIVKLLKQEPYYVVVLFEEEGMPATTRDSLKSISWANRVFYFSEGKLSETLAGFVKNKPGCWILQTNKQFAGQLKKHYCGDTYQSLNQLKNSIQKYLNQTKNTGQQIPSKSDTMLLIDQSNYQNDTILGYSQLLYILKNYHQHIQISTYSRVSMCNFIYQWTKQCQHCTYQTDMKIITRIINKVYDTHKQKKSQKQSYVFLKNKIYSYDIGNNKIINKQQIKHLTGLQQYKIKIYKQQENIGIIPNLVAICFNTANNRNLYNNIRIDIRLMDKIIAAVNLEKFVQFVLEEQERLANDKIIGNQSKQNQKNKEQL